MPNAPVADTLLAAVRTLRLEPTGRALNEWLEKLDAPDRAVVVKCMSAAHDVIEALRDPRCNSLTLDESATYLYLSRGGFKKRLREDQPWPPGMRHEEKPATPKAAPRPLFKRYLLKAWDEAFREPKRQDNHGARLVQRHFHAFTTLTGAMSERMPWFVTAHREVLDSALLPMVDPDVLTEAMHHGGGIEAMSLHDAATRGAWSPDSATAHHLWAEMLKDLLAETERAAGEAWTKTRDPVRLGHVAPHADRPASDRVRSRS